MLIARLILALVTVLGLASMSSAAPITWEFEGTVRVVNVGDVSALAGSLGVSVGASASGRVTYEGTTPGSGAYPNAVTAFEVAISSYEVEPLVSVGR